MVVIIHGGYIEIILRGATYTRAITEYMTALIYQEALLIRLSVQIVAGLE